MRTDCATSCVEKVAGSAGELTMASLADADAGHGVCQMGCGLLLSADDSCEKEQHCCVDALRTVADRLEERSATLEHEARMARLRWNRREQFLLAQVSALQNEAQLAALRYQRRLHQYLLHINSIAEQVVGYCKGDLQTSADENSPETTSGQGDTVEEQLSGPEVRETLSTQLQALLLIPRMIYFSKKTWHYIKVW
ncbi:E3 ubiquitin-protein ligase PDZRN3-B-like [Cynoglossus semilaevis]|uniref:E3 ubiquitin-protein ligase PDZRN3-B-like n=1 Tax=Cynoglossus semilaevis TaxID=244447 RepID=UPI000D62E0FB|nr:E3 ubiquitin-protein ligase PDZRN3-B-like [Cynoglossus semilaevis]